MSRSMLQVRWRFAVLVAITLAVPAGARVAAAQIMCGQTLQRAIAHTDQPDAMVFVAAASEVVSITAVPSPGTHHLFTPRWEVFDPLGRRVHTSTGERRCEGRCETVPLPTAGVFVLQVLDPGRTGAGAYTVTLEAVSGTAGGLSNGPPAPVCARFVGGLADGTQPIARHVPLRGALVPAGETDTFTFAGMPGEQVVIDVAAVPPSANPAFTPAWVLFDPQGRPIASSAAGCDGPCPVPPLPDMGVYTILVFDVGLDGVGQYDVRLESEGQIPSTTTTSTTTSTTTTSASTVPVTVTTITTTTTSVTIAPPPLPPPALVLESTLRPVGAPQAVGAAVAATDARVVLGAPGREAAFVLDVGDTPAFGTLVAELVPPEPSAGFGASVAVTAGGIAVGAPGASRAYLFTGAGGPLVLQPPGAVPADAFGAAAVAVEDDVVVGAPGTARDGVAGAGRAYRFGPTGAPLAVLEAPGEAQPGTRFGATLAAFGATVFVGAPGGDRVYAFEDDAPSRVYDGAQLAPGSGFGTAIAATDRRVYVGAPAARGGAGVVLVLEARGGTVVREIVAPDGVDVHGFGSSLLLTGTALLVGAPGAAGTPGGGAVLVFDPEGTRFVGAIAGGPDDGDLFGTALAGSAGRLLVGAPLSDAGAIDGGAAFLFPGPVDGAAPDAVFRPRLPGGEFGAAVVASGGDAVVGDPAASGERGAVERFAVADGTMRGHVGGPAADDARFGAALAAAPAGGPDEILVGAPREDDPAGTDVGAVYALADGTLRRRIGNPFPVTGDQFGFAVAVAGSEAVVGAPLAGELDTGAVHVFDRATGVHLLTLRKPAPLTGDFFGAAVAAEGDQVLVGAPLDSGALANSGAVYLFRRSTATLDRTVTAPDARAEDMFGSAVALTPTAVVVGAPLADAASVDSGRVYVFDRATGILAFTLENPTPDAGDRFGAALAVVGGGILVGAPQDDQDAPDTGAAHLFDATTGEFRQTLRNPAQGDFDRFGAAIAARGAGALIGAPGVSRVYAFRPRTPPVAASRGRVRALAAIAADEPGCGNGLVEGTEQCDDGNAVDTDDCRNDCTQPCCDIPAAQVCDDGNECTNDLLDPSTGCSNVDNGTCCTADADCPGGKCRLCLGCFLYPWECCEQGSQCLDVSPECGAQDCFDLAYCACTGGLSCSGEAVPSAVDEPFQAGCDELRLEGSFAPGVALQGNERLKLSRTHAKRARKMVRKAARMARKLASRRVVSKQCRQAILGRTRTVKQAIPKGRRLKRCVLRPAAP